MNFYESNNRSITRNKSRSRYEQHINGTIEMESSVHQDPIVDKKKVKFDDSIESIHDNLDDTIENFTPQQMPQVPRVQQPKKQKVKKNIKKNNFISPRFPATGLKVKRKSLSKTESTNAIIKYDPSKSIKSQINAFDKNKTVRMQRGSIDFMKKRVSHSKDKISDNKSPRFQEQFVAKKSNRDQFSPKYQGAEVQITNINVQKTAENNFQNMVANTIYSPMGRSKIKAEGGIQKFVKSKPTRPSLVSKSEMSRNSITEITALKKNILSRDSSQLTNKTGGNGNCFSHSKISLTSKTEQTYQNHISKISQINTNLDLAQKLSRKRSEDVQHKNVLQHQQKMQQLNKDNDGSLSARFQSEKSPRFDYVSSFDNVRNLYYQNQEQKNEVRNKMGVWVQSDQQLHKFPSKSYTTERPFDDDDDTQRQDINTRRDLHQDSVYSSQQTLTIPIRDAGVTIKKNFIKTNLQDFKEKILGAMNFSQEESESKSRSNFQNQPQVFNKKQTFVGKTQKSSTDQNQFTDQFKYELHPDFQPSKSNISDLKNQISNTEEQNLNNNSTRVEPKEPDQDDPEEDSILKYNKELDEIARNSLCSFINNENRVQNKNSIFKNDRKFDARIIRKKPTSKMSLSQNELKSSFVSKKTEGQLNISMLNRYNSPVTDNLKVDRTIPTKKESKLLNNLTKNTHLTKLLDSNDGLQESEIDYLISHMCNINERNLQETNKEEKFLLKVVGKLCDHIEVMRSKQPRNKVQDFQQTSLTEIKLNRMTQQIQEMNFEYQCQQTQIETLENFNSSLRGQIQRLEQQLHESQSKEIIQKANGERTPRQQHLEEKFEKQFFQQPFRAGSAFNKYLNVPPNLQSPVEHTEVDMFNDKFLVSNASRLSYFSK